MSTRNRYVILFCSFVLKRLGWKLWQGDRCGAKQYLRSTIAVEVENRLGVFSFAPASLDATRREDERRRELGACFQHRVGGAVPSSWSAWHFSHQTATYCFNFPTMS
jgi:hypothetical protein